jgi:hypothetical protein
MQPQCRICTNASAEQINAVLLSGGSLHSLSRQYGFERKSLRNHRAKHLPPVKQPEHGGDVPPMAPQPENLTEHRHVSPRPVPPVTPERLIDPKRPSLGTIAQLRAYYAQR